MLEGGEGRGGGRYESDFRLREGIPPRLEVRPEEARRPLPDDDLRIEQGLPRHGPKPAVPRLLRPEGLRPSRPSEGGQEGDGDSLLDPRGEVGEGEARLAVKLTVAGAEKSPGAHLKKGRSSIEITAGDGSPEPLEGGALFPPGQVSGEEASCDRRPHCKQVRRGGREKTLSRGSCRSEEHTSELQSQSNIVCRLLLEKK